MAMHVHTRTRSPMRTNTGNAKALGALPPVAGDTVHMVAVSGAHTSGLPFPPPPPPAQRRAAAPFFLGTGSTGGADGWNSVCDAVGHGRPQRPCRTWWYLASLPHGRSAGPHWGIGSPALRSQLSLGPNAREGDDRIGPCLRTDTRRHAPPPRECLPAFVDGLCGSLVQLCRHRPLRWGCLGGIWHKHSRGPCTAGNSLQSVFCRRPGSHAESSGRPDFGGERPAPGNRSCGGPSPHAERRRNSSRERPYPVPERRGSGH
mmetsp:Transcript_13480/g.24056  ORF Transcript_13480/g.24056 Transcript_13480/m.24056 type:complete len:260 (+) Transcript_13480:129-908(+)